MPVKDDRSVGWTRRSAAVSLLLSMENYRREIGLRVIAQREKRRWTQEDLAHASDLSVKTVSRLENGRHDGRRSTIEKIADALGIDPAELLGTPPTPLGLNPPAGDSDITERLDRLETDLARYGAIIELLGELVPEALQELRSEEAQPPGRRRGRAA